MVPRAVRYLSDPRALERIADGQCEAHDAEEPPKGRFGKPALEPRPEVAIAIARWPWDGGAP